VIGETSVHYLGLTEDMEGVRGDLLRKQHDVEMLWEGIRKGIITRVGTDCNYLIKIEAALKICIFEKSVGRKNL
jgi:hypothetical protein